MKASRISGKLASYRAVNDTFSDIFIHFTGDDFIYSSTSFFHFDRFIAQALQMEKTTPEELKNALEDTTSLTVWPAQTMEGYAVRNDMGLHRNLTILAQVCHTIADLQIPQKQEEVPEAVQKAREIIQHRFSEPELSVSGIAKEVGMSDSKL